MQLKIERIYHQPVDRNGYRILVDRLWPRGISKVKAHLDEWAKEIGPSNALRKWFGHEVAKYPEFEQRYRAELAHNPAFKQLLATVKTHLATENVILLYGARDQVHNQAVILKAVLTNQLHLPAQD